MSQNSNKAVKKETTKDSNAAIATKKKPDDSIATRVKQPQQPSSSQDSTAAAAAAAAAAPVAAAAAASRSLVEGATPPYALAIPIPPAVNKNEAMAWGRAVYPQLNDRCKWLEGAMISAGLIKKPLKEFNLNTYCQAAATFIPRGKTSTYGALIKLMQASKNNSPAELSYPTGVKPAWYQCAGTAISKCKLALRPVPSHRVVPASGQLKGPHAEGQAAMLREEGVQVSNKLVVDQKYILNL